MVFQFHTPAILLILGFFSLMKIASASKKSFYVGSFPNGTMDWAISAAVRRYLDFNTMGENRSCLCVISKSVDKETFGITYVRGTGLTHHIRARELVYQP